MVRLWSRDTRFSDTYLDITVRCSVGSNEITADSIDFLGMCYLIIEYRFYLCLLVLSSNFQIKTTVSLIIATSNGLMVGGHSLLCRNCKARRGGFTELRAAQHQNNFNYRYLFNSYDMTLGLCPVGCMYCNILYYHMSRICFVKFVQFLSLNTAHFSIRMA